MPNQEPVKLVYLVKGMHCPSCELLIEEKLRSVKAVSSARASQITGKVVIVYKDKPLTLRELNELFQEEGYKFVKELPEGNQNKWKEFCLSSGIASLAIVLFLTWQRLGLGKFARVDLTSSWWAFLLFGILAGTSSCAAMVGSLIVALTKQWSQSCPTTNHSFSSHLAPHFLFHGGRIMSYTVLGMALGTIGQKLHFSPVFYSFVVLSVAAGIFLSGLNMLGITRIPSLVNLFPRFFAIPTKSTKLPGKVTPFFWGMSTVFLPCGFTVTAESLALASSSPGKGGLIMGLFSLGTLPVLLSIGLSSTILFQNPRLSKLSLKVAGAVLIFFALFNLNAQLNVWGYKSLSDFSITSAVARENPAAHTETPLQGKVQTIVMEASAFGYSPNYFKVRVSTPVRWEIIDKGTSGCTNAIISPELFEGEIKLSPGKTAVKEFIPQKVGKFKFTCWMGMVSGIIEVTN
ncbi:MAG: sulfite exporter TauE/SafE family protein [Candidatus Atribacteria bacterium]|nr:sulfite exporter TauE/SafE family protein [Candidatus Atribacteria bacterium]